MLRHAMHKILGIMYALHEKNAFCMNYSKRIQKWRVAMCINTQKPIVMMQILKIIKMMKGTILNSVIFFAHIPREGCSKRIHVQIFRPIPYVPFSFSTIMIFRTFQKPKMCVNVHFFFSNILYFRDSSVLHKKST